MKNTPGKMRFAQAAALLRDEGFVLFNKRGSHRTYHHDYGRLFTMLSRMAKERPVIRWTLRNC